MNIDRITIALLILSAFVVGCAAASVYVPTATAQSQTTYEYHCEVMPTRADKLTSALNKYGQQGWRLVDAEEPRFCFIRP